MSAHPLALLTAVLLAATAPHVAVAKAPRRAPSIPFDRAAAVKALGDVDLGRCRVPTAPKGDGHVKLTFDPAGTVSDAQLDSGPFVGAIASCIVTQFKKVTVPVFQGAPVTVGKTFHLR